MKNNDLDRLPADAIERIAKVRMKMAPQRRMQFVAMAGCGFLATFFPHR